MTDIQDKRFGTPVGGGTSSLFHDEGDGTHSEAVAAHMRIWNGSSWARWDGVLSTGDIEIGAVELKDATTGNRAAISAAGAVSVDPGTVAVTGTFWQSTQPVSAAALPLPNGASTAARQDSQTTLLAGGLPAALGAGGGLKVDGSGTALPVTATLAAETTKVIGTVNQGTSPWVTSRNWTLGSGTDSVSAVQATAANLNATVVGTGTFVTQATVAQLPSTLGYAAKGSALAVVVANDQDDLAFTLQRAVVQRLDLLLSQIVANYSPSDNLY